MNKETLLAQIKQEFKDVTLGDAYTLAEADYYDTAHCYFDDMHVNRNMTREEWVKQEIEEMPRHGWWLPEEIEEAIKAIKEKRKIFNRFPNSLDIPVEYLDAYGASFVFLQPQAYLFYTPSLMIHKLYNSDLIERGFSFDSWLSTLIFHMDKPDLLFGYFSKKQFSILIEFLEYLKRLDVIHEFDKENIQIALNKIKLIENI